MNSKTYNILVPIGLIEQTYEAIEQAYLIANIIKSQITILNIIEDQGYISKFLSRSVSEQELRQTIQEELDIIVTNAELKHGIKVNSLIAKGKVYEKILEVADMINADLIIMGKNSIQSGIVEKFIGSNTLNVIRSTNCPVITIRNDNYHKDFKTIVLPLDLTGETRQKVQYAIDFAKLFNSTIKAMSVLFTDDEQIKQRLDEQMEQVKQTIESNELVCTSDIIVMPRGIKASEVIVDFSREHKADLIVLMTQQEKIIKKYFIGSSAQSVINESKVPVMSIVPKD